MARRVSMEQIKKAVCEADGYSDYSEWEAEMGQFYESIYDLVPVINMWFSGSGKAYLIEMPDGTEAVWYK